MENQYYYLLSYEYLDNVLYIATICQKGIVLYGNLMHSLLYVCFLFALLQVHLQDAQPDWRAERCHADQRW